MFGESDSESPRVPSPWDPVLSSSPDSIGKVYYSSDANFMPKLVAEAEEGNIEYKLHLILPSPARFSRLVTQLKWRLLEGGGQAFYELGVADSGALIGLTPDDLEHTLETLRSMAAEIGARVVVVKQIEVVGRGVREEDAREFAKKRKDKVRGKATAKVKVRNIVDLAQPASFSSPSLTSTMAFSLGSVTSVAASSFSSTSSLPIDSDSDFAALYFSSSSPSPPSLTASTPAGIEDAPALFVMDPEPHSTSPVVSVPIPANLARTKAEKRRLTRDIRRAERKAALVVPELALVDALGALQVTEAERGETLAPAVSLSVAETEPTEMVVDVPRMIVEAMVVRELDLEEAFLDFTRM